MLGSRLPSLHGHYPLEYLLLISNTIMAETVTTPSAEVEKKPLTKPEKPDEEAYKLALKNAEKEHADSMAKFVSSSPLELLEMSHALPGIGSVIPIYKNSTDIM